MDHETGNDERIQIRCSAATRQSVREATAALDVTYEEFVLAAAELADEKPRLFNRYLYRQNRTGD